MSDDKAKNIQNMFDDISGRYDLLNRIISLRRDVAWRKRCIKTLSPSDGDVILDLACGTGDMILAMKRTAPESRITGGDFSLNMLKEARRKTEEPLVAADACALPFADSVFDKITMVFGFRNVVDKPAALREMRRVLKPGGTLAILEFSKPKSWLFSKLYWFYFKTVLPAVGRLVSRHKSAYVYLPDSVEKFPEEDDCKDMLRQAGFPEPRLTPYDFGICSLMQAQKP